MLTKNNENVYIIGLSTYICFLSWEYIAKILLLNEIRGARVLIVRHLTLNLAAEDGTCILTFVESLESMDVKFS